MKTQFLIVLLFLLSTGLTAQNDLCLEYHHNDRVFTVETNSVYSLDHKPNVFSLRISDTIYNGEIVNVDIYRRMHSSVNEEESEQLHYFKTIQLLKPIKVNDYWYYKDAIKIDDLFFTNKIRFLRTSGFVIDVCAVEVSKYGAMKSSSECGVFERIIVKYSH